MKPGINDVWSGVIEATGDLNKEINWRNIYADLDKVRSDVKKLPETKPDLGSYMFHPKHAEQAASQTSLGEEVLSEEKLLLLAERIGRLQASFTSASPPKERKRKVFEVNRDVFDRSQSLCVENM